ncbi:MAG: ornithine carbamoyltransferase [Candidatus Margulisbacteria bacterium]|nr:ornithine carbamoyltransferase [Candidatus Margulisiibacteriota bacterium]
MKLQNFLTIEQLTVEDIEEIMVLAAKLKKERQMGKLHHILAGKALAMIFEKPSTRTRVSFDVGMYQLGGYAVNIAAQEVQLGKRESIQDVARTLSRFVDGIMVRTFSHKVAEDIAKYSTVPVINGLTDKAHPCQALADIFTIKEKLGKLAGVKIAYIGDGNNVCNSLLLAAARTQMKMSVATPKGFEPDKKIIKAAQEKIEVKLVADPFIAIKEADVVYTDVWTSMGQEKEAKKRKKIFTKYQINSKLLKNAKEDILVMHCLPAHRDEEITGEVLDSKNSIVFDQAENRLHVQKAILALLMGTDND